MPYQTSREKVEDKSDLLDSIAIKCLKQGDELELEVPERMTDSYFCWKLRELFASAHKYPRNQYDEAMRSQVQVNQINTEPGTVLLKPKPGAAFEQTGAQFDSYQDVAERRLFRNEKAEVSWTVQEDAETEHNKFQEALKERYETVQLIDREQIGDRLVFTYRLVPRQKEIPSKEEYYEKGGGKPWPHERTGDDGLTPEQQAEIEEQLQKLDHLIDEEDGQ